MKIKIPQSGFKMRLFLTNFISSMLTYFNVKSIGISSEMFKSLLWIESLGKFNIIISKIPINIGI